MQTRRLGPFQVSTIGLGCMSLSHAYGVTPTPEEGARLLNRALDLGYTFLDTAAMYGLGGNETLLGDAISARRDEYILASKCGFVVNADGSREISGRPESLKQTCEDSLRRLRTDVIDLYYLHRWDRRVPIEECVGALADLVAAGKIRSIGLSEVSAPTLRRAHAAHPITALQTEYSPWTRNPEVAVLDACRDLGVTFVAFSPVGRGFLAGGVRDIAALPAADIRTSMPRFLGDNMTANLKLLDAYTALAKELDCTPAQLSLAWLLAKGEDIIPIPGTARIDHLEENLGASVIELDAASVARVDALINAKTVSGGRYTPAMQRTVDTEELAA